MKKPHFFILGAPKCGTTTMYHWLNQQSKVFFSRIKEPHFFSTDLNDKKRVTKDIDTYLSLFQNANKDHKIFGEASVFYLYSKNAVENILNFNKDAKFLVMLRNPIDMVVSLHAQYLYSGNEIYEDFKKAWMLQDERLNGAGITKITQDPQLLQYGKVCKLGEQTQKLFQKTDGKNVLFSFLEDIKINPAKELERVTEFLEIPYEPVEFKTYNPATSRRYKNLYRFITRLNYYKKKIGIGRINSGFGPLMNMINTKEGDKYQLSTEFRNELIDFFEQDIRILIKLLKRDLSHWLKKVPGSPAT